MENKNIESNYLQNFHVGNGTKEQTISVADIEWIESSDHYVILHNHSKKFLIYESMKNLEAKLDPLKFVRVHRCFIVQVNAIDSIRSDKAGQKYILLKDATRLKVSRNKKDKLAELLKDNSISY